MKYFFKTQKNYDNLKTKELAILRIFLDCKLPVKNHQCIDLEVLVTCNFLKDSVTAAFEEVFIFI